jgi:2-hydroxy-6-oxonona-2,4-dienedioate hydrolase
VLKRTAVGIIGYVAARLMVQICRELADFRADRAQLQTRWTRIGGVASGRRLRIRSLVGGRSDNRSPPIVLVHGFGIASSYFVPLAARLARHVDVHLPELPGHGRSDHDARPLDVQELATALAAWMDARGLRRILLIGHSMGCQVSLEFATRHPDRVAGLVLIGPTSDPSARTIPRQLGRAVATLLFERPSLAIWLAVDYTRAGLRVLLTEARSMITHQLEGTLPDRRFPALVIRGRRDAIVPQRWAETVSRLLHATAPIVLPGWGHVVHYDAPTAVAEFALGLISREANGTPHEPA